jgi:type II secretory pathway pseudopilin PulG
MPRPVPPCTRQRRRAGVTLVELVVIMTIVGVSLGIVVPRLRQSERSKVDLAAMQLMHDMDLARTRALATRSLVRVAFSTVHNSYTGYLDANRDGTIGETDAERDALAGGGQRSLPAGVQYGRGDAPVLRTGDGTLPADNRVHFTIRGLADVTGTSAHVYLRSSSDLSAVSAIIILPSGLLRLRRYHNGVWN